MRVLDVSQPAAPIEKGFVDPNAFVSGVALGEPDQSGRRYAYLVEPDYDRRSNTYYPGGLQVVDVSNPAHPLLLGFFDAPGDPGYAAVYPDELPGDQYVYLDENSPYSSTSIGGGLRIIDVSDRSHPVEAGYFPDYNASHIVFRNVDDSGRRLAYASGHQALGSSIQILDVSDPLHPSLINTVNDYALDLDLVGDYLYVAEGYNSSATVYYGFTPHGLSVFDLSDPVNPLQVGLSAGFGGELAVSGSLAFVAQFGMLVYDVSDPAHPVGFTAYQGGWDAADVLVVGSYAYVSGISDAVDLRVVDVSGLVGPAFAGSYATLTSSQDLVVAGQNAYLSGSGLQIVDLSDPAVPRIAGSVDTLDYNQATAVLDGYAYLAQNYLGLRVMDVRDPDRAATVSIYDPGRDITALAAASGYVYVTEESHLPQDNPTYFTVLDVADPANPITVSVTGLPYWEVSEIVLSGNYAFLADVYQGLRILDITDLAHPVEAGSFIRDNSDRIFTNGLAVGDLALYPYVFLAENHGLRVIDVSDLAHPTQVAFVSAGATGDEFQSVALGEPDANGRRNLYVAGGEAGLLAFDVTDPANPQRIGYYTTPGPASSVVLYSDFIYLVDAYYGLSILQYTLYDVRGRVSHANHQPFAGVEISAVPGYTTTSDADGRFLFPDFSGGSYTLIPALPDYAFMPASRRVTLPPDAYDQNFTVLPTPVAVALDPGSASSLVFTDTQGLPTRLYFPAGVVSQTTLLTITPTLVADLVNLSFSGHAFELGVSQAGSPLPGFAFDVPISLTVQYSPADVRSVTDASQLTWLWDSGAGWLDAAQTCDPPSVYGRDLANGEIVLPVCRVGLYALYGPTASLLLPVIGK